MPELQTITLPRLAAIADLFEALHEQEIVYCHWKSNEHLDASLMGDTDLDVLFDEKQKAKVEALLSKLGFKRFDSISQKQYKDIVDFLGLDNESGKIIHLHTHYRLTLGEPFLKGYQLNFEQIILDERVFSEEAGVYCIDPAFELVLLFMREALKLRRRDVIKSYLRNNFDCSENSRREYKWLKEKISDEEILATLNKIFRFPQRIYPLVAGEFNRKKLMKLAPLIRSELSENRLYSPIQALLRRWYREFVVVISRKSAKLLSKPVLSKRINPRGGKIIALVGADGSGKSTVTTNLERTFGTKLDVFRIYFGRGDGRISFPRRMLMLFKRKTSSASHKRVEGKNRGRGFFKSLYKCVEALLVAREKEKNLNRMIRAKEKGMLVLCDRFPQNQVMGYNDGPLLNGFMYSSIPMFRMLARIESGIYHRAENYPPDLLFKLIADPEVVEKRKPGETSLKKLQSKIGGIRQLSFNGSCKVLTIDASLEKDEVLGLVKREIWRIL